MRLKRSPCSEKTLCDTRAESVIYEQGASREERSASRNDDPGSKETALVDKSPAREHDFSRPIMPPPELTRERRGATRHGAARRGRSPLSLPDHQADLVPNYKSH
ncbi:hypothetical protein X777_11672 [Ooceraea biroi]|uniref:Uncharacterized protein n=1 Tax=Ooceraea biroi TaxID=2015173 RepID=A0A026W425_OOCBI|nr:hypothetical protein X777_11672 [Ooceraea biroi]